MASSAQHSVEGRSEPRDEVHHRARVHDPDGRPIMLLVVNISAGGLMARCDLGFDIGQVIRVQLPLVGPVAAEIRWSLGGRIGCRFHQPVPSTTYDALLAALTKS